MRRALVGIALLAASCTARAPASHEVVFVCEHGSAKSVVAAALLNDLASRRGLPWRAVSRGLDPDAELAPAATRGLAADGLKPPAPSPIRFGSGDRAAARVVYIGDGTVELGPRGERWGEIPPLSKDYGASRDAMRVAVEALLERLTREPPRPVP